MAALFEARNHGRGQSGLSSQPSFFEMELGGLSLLPDLERYYESSVPDSIAAAIWFTGTTKKVSCLHYCY